MASKLLGAQDLAGAYTHIRDELTEDIHGGAGLLCDFPLQLQKVFSI